MHAALVIAMCLGAPGHLVELEGDPALTDFIATRLVAGGHTLVEGGEAGVVRVHVEATDDGRGVFVAVEDQHGALVERVVEGRDAGEQRVAAWLVVRGAVERADSQEQAGVTDARGEPVPRASAEADVDVGSVSSAAAEARARRPAGFSLGAMLQTAPDMALSSATFLPVGAYLGGRYRIVDGVSVAADAGYVAALSGDTILHGLPVRVGAEWSHPLDEGARGPTLAGGARMAATPTWATAGNKGAMGLGAALGVYGRLSTPLAGAVWGLVEAGVETRVLRQAVLADTGVREEALLAAPVAAGLEVRW